MKGTGHWVDTPEQMPEETVDQVFRLLWSEYGV